MLRNLVFILMDKSIKLSLENQKIILPLKVILVMIMKLLDLDLIMKGSPE